MKIEAGGGCDGTAVEMNGTEVARSAASDKPTRVIAGAADVQAAAIDLKGAGHRAADLHKAVRKAQRTAGDAEGPGVDGSTGEGMGTGERLGAGSVFGEGHAHRAIGNTSCVGVGDAGAGVEGQGGHAAVATQSCGEDRGEVLVAGEPAQGQGGRVGLEACGVAACHAVAGIQRAVLEREGVR